MEKRAHGRYANNLDRYTYEVAEEACDAQGVTKDDDDWYGLLRFDDETRALVREIAEDAVALDDAHEKDLDAAVAAILCEHGNGSVEIDWFEDEEEADAAWASLEATFEENEDEDDEGDD